MQIGEQCQKCGNDFDPLHPCKCRGMGDQLCEHEGDPAFCPVCVSERYERALREIELRTAAYRESDDWPLVSGINRVARSALGK
jgi:hypothetical protein